MDTSRGLTLLLTGIKWPRSERNKTFQIEENLGWGVTVKEVNDAVFELTQVPGWEAEIHMDGVKIWPVDTNPSTR